MQVTLIVRFLETIAKEFGKKAEDTGETRNQTGRVETIETSALLKSDKILKRVLGS